MVFLSLSLSLSLSQKYKKGTKIYDFESDFDQRMIETCEIIIPVPIY
jgi:hypothetical protein